MIIVKLWGGLCNQMFQYAFGYSLSRQTGDDVCFEAQYFNEQRNGVGRRKVVIDSYFNLTRFSLIERPREYGFFENRYINRIVRSAASGKQLKCCNGSLFYKEPYRKYQPKIPHIIGKLNYYDGYWLTSRYFSEYRHEILQEFCLDAELQNYVDEKMRDAANEPSVAVHIRRGDYLNKNKANVPGGYNEEKLNQYYQKSISYMIQHMEAPAFYVFSDDIEWCENNLTVPGYKMVFVQNNRDKGDLLDLFCISKCKHGIMSPSTFSWWGNWLRENSADSIVILPKGNYANNCFVEKNWIIL